MCPREDLKVEVVAGCVHPLHKGFPSKKNCIGIPTKNQSLSGFVFFVALSRILEKYSDPTWWLMVQIGWRVGIQHYHTSCCTNLQLFANKQKCATSGSSSYIGG